MNASDPVRVLVRDAASGRWLRFSHPREVVTALITFESLDGAAKAVSAVLAAGILPRTLELMDEMSVQAVDGKAFHFPSGTRAAVILEVDGNSQDALFEEMGRAAECCERFGVDRFRTLTREEIEARYREFQTCTAF